MSDGRTAQGERWLTWAREIESLAQTSRHYARNDFEQARAERLLEIAAEIVAGHSNMTANEALAAFKAQPGYVTPKVDVRGALFEADRLLMVRESIDGCWTLPGGWADVGEPPALAVEREVFEESGLNVRATHLIAVYDANRIEGELSLFHAYKLVFLCQPAGGQIQSSTETSEVAFFSIDDLPSPLSPYRTTPRLLADVLAFRLDPTRPAVFD